MRIVRQGRGAATTHERKCIEATLHHAAGGPSASAGPDISLVVCWDEEDGEIEVGAVIILWAAVWPQAFL